MHTAIRGSRGWLLVRSRGPILDACSVARLSVMSRVVRGDQVLCSAHSALSQALSTSSHGNKRYIIVASLATVSCHEYGRSVRLQ